MNEYRVSTPHEETLDKVSCTRVFAQITSGSIANNTEIDVIWHRFQESLEPLRVKLNRATKQEWQEWEIPREAAKNWSETAKDLHASWWEQRILRQKAIDASIAAKLNLNTYTTNHTRTTRK